MLSRVQVIQGAEVEDVGMRVGCANDLLILRRARGIGRCAPEGRGRAGQRMSALCHGRNMPV